MPLKTPYAVRVNLLKMAHLVTFKAVRFYERKPIPVQQNLDCAIELNLQIVLNFTDRDGLGSCPFVSTMHGHHQLLLIW